MKILHVVHAYPPSIGGCQQLVERLSRELVRQHGDEVSVFTTVARNTEHFVYDDGQALPATIEKIDGVTVRRFRVFNRWTRARMLLASLAFRWRLPGNELFRTWLNGPIVFGLERAVASSGADVVMASAFPLLHMYAALRGAQRAGIPAVLLGALHVEDRWNYDRDMIFRAIGRCDAYVALTEFERQHVIARGAAPDRVHVMGGGVDLDRYARATGDSARRRFGLGEGAVVTMVAKHVSRKRFDLLIRAMEIVWQSVPQAQLFLAGGRTPYTGEIEALLAGLGPRRQAVQLLSDVDENDKISLLAASDVFVLPSARDSFGLVFLEAWACRVPVVGVVAGAIESLVTDGEDGLLVPYEDVPALAGAIQRLLEDPELRRRMGERGFDKVLRRFSWGIVTREMRTIYEHVVRQRDGDRSGRDD